MKAILALGAAAVLSGCAYYDPYVYDAPYYGTAPGYYGGAPQPYYYGSAVAPYGYGGYGYAYGDYGYPSYPAYPWIAPTHRHPHPGTHTPRPGGDRRSGGSAGGSGSGGILPGRSGGDDAPIGGGSGGMLPGRSGGNDAPIGGGSGGGWPGK